MTAKEFIKEFTTRLRDLVAWLEEVDPVEGIPDFWFVVWRYTFRDIDERLSNGHD